MVDTDTGMFICKVVIGVALIAKITLALIAEHRKNKLKKVINVASRAKGHVDEDGNLHVDDVLGFDIVE